jgi:MFS family permease
LAQDSLLTTDADRHPTGYERTSGDYKIWQVISASAVGTMIEWYDFYIFGSLAAVISPLFYPPGNDTFAYIAYLATFAVGFIVRPFGALFFGRIGDIVGRKYAFLVTLLIMGGATALIGFLPTYAQIGIAAPVILLLLRSCRVWRSAESMAGRRSMSRNMCRIAGVVSTRVSFRSLRRSDSSSRSP